MQLTPRVRHVAAVDRSVGHEGEGRVEEWRRPWKKKDHVRLAARIALPANRALRKKRIIQSVSVRAIPYPCYRRPRWIHRLHACWEAAAADMYDDMGSIPSSPEFGFPQSPSMIDITVIRDDLIVHYGA